jgi:type III secretory pathway component EscT
MNKLKKMWRDREVYALLYREYIIGFVIGFVLAAIII